MLIRAQLLTIAIVLLIGCNSRDIPNASNSQTNASDGDGRVTQAGRFDLPDFPVVGERYEIVGIATDNKEDAVAKSNVEGALNSHPDLDCMVGLWAYNPPAILSGLRSRDMLGKIKIIGFDEHPETLEGVVDGTVFGTIVQQPYLFGFRSVELLSAIARGDQVDIPDDGLMFVDHRVVRSNDVQEFITLVDKIKNDQGPVPNLLRNDYDMSKKPRLMFLTNAIDPFWVLAQKGCETANRELNADCVTVMPPSDSSAESQKTAIEQFINSGGEGLAISPVNADDQVDIINKAAETMTVICQDSDSPNSDRKFYLGTSNYLAGRSAGKLIKEALPEGGKIMLFVGRLEVLNARERSVGLIDELLDKPLPPEYASK